MLLLYPYTKQTESLLYRDTLRFLWYGLSVCKWVHYFLVRPLIVVSKIRRQGLKHMFFGMVRTAHQTAAFYKAEAFCQSTFFIELELLWRDKRLYLQMFFCRL